MWAFVLNRDERCALHGCQAGVEQLGAGTRTDWDGVHKTRDRVRVRGGGWDGLRLSCGGHGRETETRGET